MGKYKIDYRNYIALEELNFSWSSKDVNLFDALWLENRDIGLLAETFNRPMVEVVLLLFDRAYYDFTRVNEWTISCSNRTGKYIALEEMDFLWSNEELEMFDRLWAEGHDIWVLAKVFKRNELEIALLIMDRDYRGYIKPRIGGVFGGKK